MTKQTVSLVVTDLDNTLFDWVGIWHASFSAMLSKTVEISGVSVEQLESEWKAIHQLHGTTEYAFALQELPSLLAKHSADEITQVYREAINAYRAARDATLREYPRALETLQELKRRGTLIIGYTESMKFYSSYRMRHLDLDLVMDFVYLPPDAELPAHMTPEQVEKYPKDMYEPRHAQLRVTPAGEKKPNPKLLLDIIAAVGGTVANTIYVGDSQIKDIAMAQDAGVTEVWAKYGVSQNRPEYGLLRRVTHWTDEDVAKEKTVAEELERKGLGLNPQYVLEHGFYELLNLFDFQPFVSQEAERNSEVLH